MANFNLVWPWVVKWESPKYVNNPGDNGGPTKYGVTLATMQTYGHDLDGDGKITAKDVALLTEAQAEAIAKKAFWDFFKGDEINDQSIAQIIFDWGWASGTVTAAKQVQHLLELVSDGKFGPNTIAKINAFVQAGRAGELFTKIKNARLQFVKDIVSKNPSQVKWLQGWENRIEDIPDITKKNF